MLHSITHPRMPGENERSVVRVVSFGSTRVTKVVSWLWYLVHPGFEDSQLGTGHQICKVY